MSELINIARAVATELSDFHAEVSFVPEFELRDLDDMRMVVVPLSTEFKPRSRAMHEELLKVQVGILKRCEEAELETMIQFVENLGLGFLNKKLADATCVSIVYNPIYSPEHLRERGQFTSVIELTFKFAKK